MSNTYLECKNLIRHHGHVPAIQNVTFRLEKGEILSILGENGCGKTSLLRVIAGFDQVTDGEIFIRDELVSSRNFHMPPDQRKIGMVFQEHALFPHMSVQKNIEFGLRSFKKSTRIALVRDAIKLVGLENLEDRFPNQLSGGQQQRVALARSLAPLPDILLFDEPFGNLDIRSRGMMRRDLSKILHEQGVTSIFVTHDRDEAFSMADRVGIMNAGKFEQMDRPEKVFSSPTSQFVAQASGSCSFIPGIVANGFVDTELGKLKYICHNTSNVQGQEMELLIHPKDFQARVSESGLGTIASKEFRNGESILHIKLQSGLELELHQPPNPEFLFGTNVKLDLIKDSPFIAFKR